MVVARSNEIIVLIVKPSPMINQVIIGKVIILVAKPINLTGHNSPKPKYPTLVA